MAAAVQQRACEKDKSGLEVPRTVTYKGWEPGGVYTKLVQVKNVHLKTQKIRYRISGERFFSAVYPQPIVLGTGNTYTLPITFKPLEKDEYTDTIEFTTPEGVSTVPLKAVLPKSRLALPDGLKFGCCATQKSIPVMFDLTNTSSQVATDFKWEYSDPFRISPSSGSVRPGTSCRMVATFTPTAACKYTMTAVCHHGADYSCSKEVKLEGSGKYPHLRVELCERKGAVSELSSVPPNEVCVEFDHVAVGMTATRKLRIFNTTPVPASYTIVPRHHSKLVDPAFSFSQTKGTIQPLADSTIKVMYSPTSIHQPTTVCFTLVTEGGLSRSTITCTGEPMGPCVAVDSDAVCFGSVECGSTASAVIQLTNTSLASTIYQLQIPSDGVFHTSASTGEINANSSITITVCFTPTHPIPYHSTVMCLLLHQEPLTIHFIGSAYTDTVKPVLLTAHHLRLYEAHIHTGLTKHPPEYLKQCIKDGRLTVEKDGSLLPTELFEPPNDDLPVSSTHQSGYHHYLSPSNDVTGVCHVSVDTDVLEYGYTPVHRCSQGKVVMVTNHTRGTVCAVWMTGKRDVFRVLPEERELQPGASAPFTISFLPNKPNQFYSKQLECYIFYKTMRDYTDVEDRAITLPWSVSVTALAHSFQPDSEHLAPTVSYSSRNLVFPGTIPGQPAFRTLAVRNDGDTAVMFHFKQDPSGVFTIKPSCGLITGMCQLFVVQMLPQLAQVYQRIAKCLLNNSSSFNQELLLSGSAEPPLLELENKGEVYFRPTHTGCISTTTHWIRNVSNLPVRFSWRMKSGDCDAMCVSQSQGILQPHEKGLFTWQFTPLEMKHYHSTAVITAVYTSSQAGDSTACRTRSALRLFGQGTTGELKCTPDRLDGGPVMIGTSARHCLTLINQHSCPLQYKLAVEQVLLHSEDGGQMVHLTQQPHGMELSQYEGELQPKSQQVLYVTLRPSRTSTNQSIIKYQLQHCESSDSSGVEWKALCSVSAVGSYPSLSVVDVRGHGVAHSLSKSQIWNMLNIDQLNKHLKGEPSEVELRYAIATRHSNTRRVPTLTRPQVQFNYGAVPVHHEKKSTFYLLLANNGSVPTQWALQLPMDMYLEPEYWADTGDIDEIEQHEMDVVTNKLFSVKPKQGQLPPGGKVVVEFTFRHSHQGTSRLPVMLKIHRGREILLNFTGTSSPINSPCVYLVSHFHTFTPVSVCCQSFPQQMYELFNAGDQPVQYRIDTAPLEEFRKSNYNMSIMECLSPEGELLPGLPTLVPFIFSPREAKTYTVDLPVIFSNGDSVLVTFRGEGLTDNVLEPSQSNNIPCASQISLPNQTAELSLERLTLGHLPMFCVVRKLVFLRNTSSHTLSFQWLLDSTNIGKIVSVQPRSGYLQPNTAIMCRFTFKPCSSPTIYDIDLSCQLMDETERAVYKQKLKEWEKKIAELKQSFTISESFTGRGSSKQINAAQTTDLKPYSQTLAEYEQWKKLDLSVKTRQRPRVRKPIVDEPPAAPVSLCLHLGITAQTHSIPDYCRVFSDFDSFYIDYQSVLAASDTPQDGQIMSQQEMDITTDILGQMLKEMMEETNFHASLRSIVEEPIPYFTQFSSSESNTYQQEEIARHVYAMRLEGLPSGVDNGSAPSQHSQEGSPTVRRGHSVTSDIKDSGDESPPPLPPSLEESEASRLRSLPEFGSIAESIVENTLLNIMKEVMSGELNLRVPLFNIARPPLDRSSSTN